MKDYLQEILAVLSILKVLKELHIGDKKKK